MVCFSLITFSITASGFPRKDSRAAVQVVVGLKRLGAKKVVIPPLFLSEFVQKKEVTPENKFSEKAQRKLMVLRSKIKNIIHECSTPACWEECPGYGQEENINARIKKIIAEQTRQLQADK